METLHKQIRRAHRRLLLQSLLGKLAWCWFVTFSLAALAIGLAKVWPSADEPLFWSLCLAAAAGTGALAAGIWTWLRRSSSLEAAVEIDRRFGLKERVSSTLALGRDQLASEIGQALLGDARERVGRLDVAEQFAVRPGRRALLPLVPVAVAAALALLIQGSALETPAAATPAATAQVKKTTQTLVKKIDQQRKEAAEKGLTEADALLKRIEEAAKNLAEKGTADRKQALVAMNELVKEAEKRKQQLASGDDIKQQFNNLKNLPQGPADKLGQALKNGELAKAIKEIDDLKEQLKADKLDAKDKEALAKQLEGLKEALEKKVQAHQQAMEDLKQQVEQQRREGNTAAADKLQQQLDKLAAKAPQVEALKEMAQKLGQASDCMKNGDCQQASAALAKMGEKLAEMQQETQELEMLDSTLEELTDSKAAMACKECDGEGCKNCQSEGMKLSDKWSRSEMAKGGGVGAGRRAESKNDTDFYDSQVKQNVKKGGAVMVGTAEGPNRKGQVQQEIKGEFESSEQQTAEALSGQRLPHDYRDHAKKYFDALREGRK